MTPEWIAKATIVSKLHVLVQANQLLLTAIDEAHLYSEWSDFHMNHPNIALHTEELVTENEFVNAIQFSAWVAEIIQPSSAVIYTDFTVARCWQTCQQF